MNGNAAMASGQAGWTGLLRLGHGWAHYRGPAGDTGFHRHHAVQAIFAETAGVCVQFEQDQLEGDFLFVPSGKRHRLTPNRVALDILYVEPGFVPATPERLCDIAAWFAHLDGISPTEPHPGTAPWIASAMDAVETALDGRVMLADIAAVAGLGKSRFAALFRETTGLPLRRYVLWRHLNRAIGAIATGGDVTAAAHLAGFADSAHFARTMKANFGVSASDSLLRIRMVLAPVGSASVL